MVEYQSNLGFWGNKKGPKFYNPLAPDLEKKSDGYKIS